MKLTAALIGVVVVGLVVTEAAMQPTASDRVTFYAIFGGVALLAAALGAWTVVWSRKRSLRVTMQLLAVASVVVAGAAVAVSAWSMVINPHDLRVVLIALGLGVALGVTLAVTVTGRLTADLDRLVETVSAVGAGDLDVETGIARSDELGAVAHQVDAMIDRLREARETRRRDEAARREFLAAIGHDLRTPLTAIRVAVEAIEDGMVDDPKLYLKAVKADIDALSHLIDDLAVLSAVEAGSVRPDTRVDVAELVDETLEAMAPLATEVRLAGETPGPVLVSGDASALGRLLRNLVDNAIQHAPTGSVVTVAVDAADGLASVAVSDRGPGFGPEMASRAFDRFATGDPARRRGSGSGLGLAIAKAVVEAHGGRIWIDDTVAAGATVRLTIPLDQVANR